MKNLRFVGSQALQFSFILTLIFAFSSCEKNELGLDSTTATNENLDFRSHNSSDAVDLYVSSNTAGQIAILDVEDVNSISTRLINVGHADADGIYYDQPSNEIYQVNRSNNNVKVYSTASMLQNGESPNAVATSTSNFTNGREMAVMGNYIIVAQDADASNGNTNKLVVYERTPSGVSLYRTYTTTINLWGIYAVDNNLYAIEDNSERLAFFYNFLSNADGTMVRPSVSVAMAGIIRTHGLVYNAEDDVMILTDVADGGNANDGAFHVINNWTTEFNRSLRLGQYQGGTIMTSIPLSKQIRVAGSNTMLGNPVDVDYNPETGEIYIAERANGGGRILVFSTPTSNGNYAPIYNQMFSGASAVYLNYYEI